MAGERQLYYGMMFRALESGSSFNKFVRDARSHGLSVNRSALLPEWREIKLEVQNAQYLKTVQSGEVPTHLDISQTRYAYSEPWVYKARVQTQISRRAPVTERFVTVLSSRALTMEQILTQVESKWPQYEYGKKERLRTIEPTAAWHIVKT